MGIWGLTELETKFDSTWFLPQDSYISKWVTANAKYFPNDGERVTVYITDVNLTTDLSKIATFIEKLEDSQDVVSSVNSWIPGFKNYLDEYFDIDITETDNESESDLYEALWYFLFSPNGYRFLPNFIASSEDLDCTNSISDVYVSSSLYFFTAVVHSYLCRLLLEFITLLNEVQIFQRSEF